MSSAIAVIKFTTSSNLVGCSTGRTGDKSVPPHQAAVSGVGAAPDSSNTLRSKGNLRVLEAFPLPQRTFPIKRRLTRPIADVTNR
jgi:hypothetical protein